MARDLVLERTWRKRVKQQQRSGLTMTAFCKERGLVLHQFAWWRRELKRRQSQTDRTIKKPTSRNGKRSETRAANHFLPLRLTGTSQFHSAIEIILDTPRRLAIRPGFDSQLLADILRVLESAAC